MLLWISKRTTTSFPQHVCRLLPSKLKYVLINDSLIFVWGRRHGPWASSEEAWPSAELSERSPLASTSERLNSPFDSSRSHLLLFARFVTCHVQDQLGHSDRQPDPVGNLSTIMGCFKWHHIYRSCSSAPTAIPDLGRLLHRIILIINSVDEAQTYNFKWK